MKIKLFSAFMIMALVLGFGFSGASADAYNTAFTTAITYQNVGDAPTTQLKVAFYDSPSDTTPTEITRPNLNPGASDSLYIGGLDQTVVGNGFQGAAVMTADQPLLATLVQLAQPSATTPVKNRPLSNGFSEGAPQALIATVLKNTFGVNSIFSVQNVGTSATTATARFYNLSATQVHSIAQALEPGAAFYVDAGTIAQLGASFNGSVVVETTGGTGSIVATSMELGVGSNVARAFEGVGTGATTFYMPSALSNFTTAYGVQDTAYAVQNTSTTNNANVTVTYSNGLTQQATIGPGAKATFVTDQTTGMPDNFIGAATITSNQPVIAIGKAYDNVSGLTTAFLGASSGANKVALPYVRWATDANWGSSSTNVLTQRVFIAIQNIGGAPLAAGSVIVEYYDFNGTLRGTHTLGAIPVGGKVNSNATNAGLTEFGFYGGKFGGGAIVKGPAGSQLAVVARVATLISPTVLVGEDYNGMPAP